MALVVALLSGVAGWWLPALIARIPERDAGAETTYAVIASPRWLPATMALVAAGVGAVLGWARAGEPDVLAFAVLGLAGTAMGYVDLRRHLLPDRLTVPTLLVGGVLLAVAALVDADGGAWHVYARAWACAGGLLLFYLALALVYPAGLGLGDVKLAGSLGLYLGWLGWWGPVVGTVAAFLIGGAIGLVLLATRKAHRRSAVPFGPSMLLGALVTVVWGEAITAWYLG